MACKKVLIIEAKQLETYTKVNGCAVVTKSELLKKLEKLLREINILQSL